MPLENIRLSQSGRDQLLKLKRHTSIANWNVLCRWAYCLSLAEPSPPRRQKIATDSSVEMTWRTFGGEFDDVYRGLARDRTFREVMSDQMDDGELFRLHLHRGIGYLAGDRRIKDIAGLLRMAVERDVGRPEDEHEDETSREEP